MLSLYAIGFALSLAFFLTAANHVYNEKPEYKEQILLLLFAALMLSAIWPVTLAYIGVQIILD